ncbi:aspartyl-phosphate phosphatase Spo0E family protein [Proteiniborus sp. MB09-C3]|uniref:aspartyl-phosphate phosphatase Spo0E family protein n=1 Tax=Proteiniborus sp. MB09-C3 TaxID=3050072 RepID=UPI0025534AE6|nr:aspartyl-phosphate phosphatase Spo0E family protein [Proteiniborus sp. MB09-C3]WIV11165.1 aspartyl-phosphate phosphatase Spo0E family protein [Proteiniborus sp. MB09-C3]
MIQELLTIKLVFLFFTSKERIKILKQDNLESLREKLNKTISDEKLLTSKEIVEMSQQLDELIVLEYETKIKSR